MSVKHQRKEKENCIYDDIQRSKVNWYKCIGTTHKGLKRIYAKSSILESSNAYRCDYDTHKRHNDSF